MVRDKSKKRFAEGEEDPMAGTSNLVDAMLVIAVGLLIFVVISWIVLYGKAPNGYGRLDVQQKALDESSSDVTEVAEGQVLNESPDTSDSSGSGYMEMGKVYEDPSTGKLIMVED